MSNADRTAALRRALAGHARPAPRPSPDDDGMPKVTAETAASAATSADDRAAEPHAGTNPNHPTGDDGRQGSDALPLRVIGYVRVSTAGQDVKGYGLRAQREAIEHHCTVNGHELLTVTSDVVSGGKAEQMHGRAIAIAALEAGMADVLLVRALDRATRDQLDAAQLYKRAEEHGWILADCEGANSSDPSQRLTADIRLVVGAEERRRISQRTREGLARARREGKRLGRPSKIPRPVIEEIIIMRRDEGLGPKAIANHLDAAGVPTPAGGYRWHYSSVRRILNREGVA